MNFNANLKKFQKYLADNEFDYAFVFSNDEFLKECSNLEDNSRYLISGFTGTAGDMLVSQRNAYLFVDGRYHIQVDEQTDSKVITPVKLQLKENLLDKIQALIKNDNIKSTKILIASKKISVSYFKKLENALKNLKVRFVFENEDSVCKLFATKSTKHVYKVRNVGIKQVGKYTCDKLKGLKQYENDFLLVFTNDEVCYLANIRANQTPFSSSLDSFALVSNSRMLIFCDLKNIPNDVLTATKEVIYKDFSDFNKVLKNIKSTVFYEENKTPLYYLQKLKDSGVNIKKIKESPVAKMKAVKNKVELSYIRECYYKSDIGILNAIKYLNNCLMEGKKITCGEFLAKLVSFEKEQGAVDLSFNPILAVNERSAIIHCTEFNPKQIIKDGDLILLDFGVYFDGGYATDMTRTFVAGKSYKNETMKIVYTTVLKAFLNALYYPITKDTMFFDLDNIARKIIGSSKLKGFNFNHGTGHGIGLNVHEMPPVVSSSEKSMVKLKPNMVFSIEPGMYKEGVGGVRIENSVYTVRTEDGIKLKTLTNLPFDEKLVNFKMLSKKELKWYNDYQSKALK